MTGTRMAVVWCPDWPVVAWGVPLDEPAAVVTANRVVATSPAARAEGVALGQRRRDAQGRCPGLAVLERDLAREVRLFDPVVAAMETFTPAIEIAGPGLAGFPTRGPSRFFGGDQALADRVLADLGPVLARRGEVRLGLADGTFAARLAARSVAAGRGPRVVPPGRSGRFLADLPIATLEVDPLVGVLQRLGLTTLGAFASLPAADVVGRFGRDGLIAHRLARGDDEVPPDLRRPVPDLAVTWSFDPPANRIESCAFVAKSLADDLHTALSADGLACIRVAIEVETDRGEVVNRLWRHEGALSAAAMAERARWQLDGWLRRRTDTKGEGIVRLTLVPDDVVAATGRQLGFWGGRSERTDEVTRAVARLQGLLGPEAVMVPEHRGGIAPAERITLVPAAAVDLGEERPAAMNGWIDEPWPGRLPAPSPARIAPDPIPVDLFDDDGTPVGVTGRGEITGEPVLLRQGRTTRAVTGWTGPWPCDQRWWDHLGHRRRARLQLTVDDGTALLLTIERGAWGIEGIYD